MIKLRSVVAVAVILVSLVAQARAAEPAGNDNPHPFVNINDDAELIGAIQIDDAPDPLIGGAISDGPDPISGDSAPVACVVEGPEPFGTSTDDDSDVVHGVICRISWTAVVVVWVAR